MGKADFLKGIKMLESFYKIEFSQDDLRLWYEATKEIPFKTFISAIGSLVKTNKFRPTIAEILERCESVEMDRKVKIIDLMSDKGYFKNDEEYFKSLDWIADKNVPDWLEKDMEAYSKNQKLIVEKDTEGLEELEEVLKDFN